MKRAWLISYREQLKLTQTEAAKNIGISNSYYNQIESGERNPSGKLALRIATFYQFNMSKFFIIDCSETQHFKEVN